MAGREGQRSARIAIPIACALLVHGLLAGGLGAAEHFGWTTHKVAPQAVEMVILPPPPPKVELPPPPPDVVPVPPPPALPEVAPAPPAKPLARKLEAPPPKAPPPDAPPPTDTPAPGPPSDEAPSDEEPYQMPAAGPGGTMGVQEGGTAPKGGGSGVPRGKGTGTGGGGPESSTGTGPRIAVAGSAKRNPVVDGDFDHVLLGKDYPADAKRLAIEGQVQVRLLVDERGRVVQTKLVKGLGYGLDQRALAIGKTIKFKPALDADDQPVAMWIVWSFNFELPE